MRYLGQSHKYKRGFRRKCNHKPKSFIVILHVGPPSSPWCCNSLQWRWTRRFPLKWVRNKREALLLWREIAAQRLMLKLEMLLRLIIRQRSNLGPDWLLQAGDAASWWTTIDWWERGDTVARHWFSANAVVKSRWNKRAGSGGGGRGVPGYLLKYPEVDSVFYHGSFFFAWRWPSQSNKWAIGVCRHELSSCSSIFSPSFSHNTLNQ